MELLVNDDFFEKIARKNWRGEFLVIFGVFFHYGAKKDLENFALFDRAEGYFLAKNSSKNQEN